MANIKLTNDQLRLIETALDFYSRVGAADLVRILEHESIDKILTDKHTDLKKLEVHDNTTRGIITEIGDGYVKTRGSWGNGMEEKTWTDVDKITLSPDYGNFHKDKDHINIHLGAIKDIITSNKIGLHGNYGIHNGEISDSCRTAYDILQVIRHEFWKKNSDSSGMSVASSVSLTGKEEKVEVKLDTISEIRKKKIDKLNKNN